MRIKILYEDKDILAVDKPAGVLVDEILEKFPGCLLANRLDKETSGVMLLAKNEKAHEFIKRQFKNREVKKIYYAVVVGDVKKDRGIINKPIGRSPKDFRRRLSGRGARGEMREAITEYKVLKRFGGETKPQVIFSSRKSHPVLREGSSARKLLGEKSSNFTVLEIRPRTGRTHQIRVHMKYINHPIVGDSLYNPVVDPTCVGLTTGYNPNGLPLRRGRDGGGKFRMMLHAKSIEFKGLKGNVIKVESPLPEEFQGVL